MKNTLCHISVSVIGADRFSEALKEVNNPPHAHVQLRTVTDVNIHHCEELILGNRQIILHDTASSLQQLALQRLLLRHLKKQNIWENVTA
jgi:hypothetical protein